MGQVNQRDLYLKVIHGLRRRDVEPTGIICSNSWFVEYQIALRMRTNGSVSRAMTAESMEVVGAALEGVPVSHVNGIDDAYLIIDGSLYTLGYVAQLLGLMPVNPLLNAPPAALRLEN